MCLGGPCVRGAQASMAAGAARRRPWWPPAGARALPLAVAESPTESPTERSPTELPAASSQESPTEPQTEALARSPTESPSESPMAFLETESPRAQLPVCRLGGLVS